MRLLYKLACALFLILLIAFSGWLMVNASANPLPFSLASLNPTRTQLIRIGFLAWLIFPPTAMFIDLTVLSRNFDLVDMELVKYTHESLTNIWIALVITYIAIFGYGAIFAVGN